MGPGRYPDRAACYADEFSFRWNTCKLMDHRRVRVEAIVSGAAEGQPREEIAGKHRKDEADVEQN